MRNQREVFAGWRDCFLWVGEGGGGRERGRGEGGREGLALGARC